MSISKVGGEGYDESDKRLSANGAEKVATYKETDPQMLFLICRSKNLNLVAYEVVYKKDASGNYLKENDKYILDTDAVVNGYWITGEPSYMENNAKDGTDNRRSDLSFIEKKLAYGINAKKSDNNTYTATVGPVDKPFVISFDESGRGIAKCKLNGQDCIMQYMFVKSIERTFLHPKCLYVDIYGVNEAGEQVIERVLA